MQSDINDRAVGGRRATRAAIGSWILFDWAQQPFFTLVTTFVFAPYFAARLASNPVEGQALWGYATAAAGLAIALGSPVLGAIADAAGARKPWIAAFSALLVAGSVAVWFAAPGAEGAVALALVAFAIGTVGAEFATVFTNAMMPDLVGKERLGRLSGTGWAFGYLGGLVSLCLTLGFLVASPETGRTLIGLPPVLGLDPAQFDGDRAAGPFTALWYVVFVTPLFLFTPDVPRRMSLRAATRSGFANLRATLTGLRSEANVVRYLVAHMVYSDGLVALFAFGGIYAASIFGWNAIELGVFGILIIVCGTITTFLAGRIDDGLGSKAVILGSLALLIVACIGMLSLDRDHVGFVIPVAPPGSGDGLFASTGEQVFLLAGILIGISAGPLQAASRSLMVRVAPQERMTEFFGLYALAGRLTSFSGPLTVGLLTALSGSQRTGISILLAFFVAGGLLLSGVRPSRD